MIKRRRTKIVTIGSVKVGAGFPISIQSMPKTDVQDVSATVRQIRNLQRHGCEIVRVAVKNIDSARSLDKIKAKISIPLVADIHFNYRLGLEAIARGVDALRLNPGNIYRRKEVEQIAKACKKRKIPIRVGVNSGSLRNAKCKMQNAKLEDLMVKSAIDYIKLLESFDFYDIIVSLKASTVAETVSAYRKAAGFCNYPFHLGITACGLPEQGAIKSAIGIGSLLLEGIGDTIRVSLTANPQEEIKAAKEILQSLGLRRFGPEIIACPTCGRTQVNLIKIVKDVKRRLDSRLSTLNCKLPPKVAIMGCEVNGPQEARQADIGLVCGKKRGILFKKGRIIKKIPQEEMVASLVREISLRLYEP